MGSSEIPLLSLSSSLVWPGAVEQTLEWTTQNAELIPRILANQQTFEWGEGEGLSRYNVSHKSFASARILINRFLQGH